MLGVSPSRFMDEIVTVDERVSKGHWTIRKNLRAKLRKLFARSPGGLTFSGPDRNHSEPLARIAATM